jgi:hypothetical protein
MSIQILSHAYDLNSLDAISVRNEVGPSANEAVVTRGAAAGSKLANWHAPRGV